MATNTSKVEARRRVREAQARANEARAQRERANVEDAATFMVAAGRVSEVDAWEAERLAQVREQVRGEANRRRADHRTEAVAAIARMQDRGETLATIAELAGVGVGEIRGLLRYAPRTETHTPGKTSGALGGGVGSAEHAAGSATAAASDVGLARPMPPRWAAVMPLVPNAPMRHRPGGAYRLHAINVVKPSVTWCQTVNDGRKVWKSGACGSGAITSTTPPTVGGHQRNAKLQLTVTLASDEPVPGLYIHPDHRRRLRRPAVRGTL